ncbi:hypothetical protein HYU16_02160 [Candidatus Woesearchaeota archaeon]|nr:hypothetical protein [Candidatus Woesearchaeota archaeon]
MATQLTPVQILTAKQLFAVSADPRRFLLAFKVLDTVPRTNSGLEEKLRLTHPEVERLLPEWCGDGGKYLGLMCGRALSAIGLAAFEEVEVTTSRNSTFPAMAWHSTPLASRLFNLAHYVQEAAYQLGISPYILFGRLSGPRLKAPLKKALIISELAAQANYTAGTPVPIGNLEDRVGLPTNVIYDHLERFRLAGLVDMEPLPAGDGKMFNYRWSADEPPSQALAATSGAKLSAAVKILYESKLSQNGAFVPASSFYPGVYSGSFGVRRAFSGFVASGVVERRTKYHDLPVRPSQLCIDAAVKNIDPAIAAIAGSQKELEKARAYAASFNANKSARLVAITESFLFASKII